MKRFVIYSRQSKESGLQGQMTLETADYSIRHYLMTVGKEGIDYEVLGRFEEVKSGFGKSARNRDEFNKAVKLCYDNKETSTLLVSNISRLSRNTAYGSQIVEDLNVVLASNPQANRTMKNLMLVMAEDESMQQSIRRKSAVMAKKERCEKNGDDFIWGGNSPQWHKTFQENKAKGLHKRPAFIQKSRDDAQPVVKEITNIIKYSRGSVTQTDIAIHLNSAGLTTARGGEFTKGSVSRMIKKFNIDYRNKCKHDNLGG